MSRSNPILAASLLPFLASLACGSGGEPGATPPGSQAEESLGAAGAPMVMAPPEDAAVANGGGSSVPIQEPPREVVGENPPGDDPAGDDPSDDDPPAADAGAPVVDPPEPLEPLPADLGTYRGLTGQSGPFSFTLEEIGITRLSFEWVVTGCSGLSGGDVDEPPRPVDGTFEIQTSGGPGGVVATITGRFTSRTTATGTASYRVIPTADPASCRGTNETTWTAELPPAEARRLGPRQGGNE